MASILQAVRDASINNQSIDLDTENGLVTIKDPSTNQPISWPRKTLLPWRLKNGSFLEIDALVVLMHHSHGKLSEYIKQCRLIGASQIPFIEWPHLREYIKGTVSTSSCIDVKGLAALTNQQDEGPAPVDENQSINQSTIQPTNQSIEQPSGPSQQMSQWTLEDVMAQERVVANRVTFMQGKRPLSAVIELYDRTQSEREKKRAALSKLKAEQRKAGPTNQSTNSKANIPLLVVPSSLSSSITLYNVKQFLESGNVISTADARAASPAKPSRLTIERPSIRDRERLVVWEVIDDTSKLRTPEDWSRVVAVFVAGPEWQFDNWPYTSIDPSTNQPKPNPAKIFEQVCPFHVRYENDAINKNVANWKLHKLTVNPAKSYNDRSQAMEFWQILTEFVQSRKQFSHLNV